MPINIKSLKDHVVESISSVLWNENFPRCDLTPLGILALVDAIASYHEEGKELFPHILITTDISGLLKSIPSVQKIKINLKHLETLEFVLGLKLCAPLAIEGWIQYIEVSSSKNTIEYGLISSELSETSPTLHRQLLGDLSSQDVGIPFIYMSNVGQRTVLIEGQKSRIAISLSLKATSEFASENIPELSNYVVKDCDSDIRDCLVFYFEKLFNTALKECHGTLVGVVRGDPESQEILKGCLEDGTYLQDPIDIAAMVRNSEAEKSREASTIVRIYSTIVRNMLNFDGITIFSTDGKIIGYHCFIKQSDISEVSGGARSRAFEAMIDCKAFVCCLYKSQDGNEKLWSNR